MRSWLLFVLLVAPVMAQSTIQSDMTTQAEPIVVTAQGLVRDTQGNRLKGVELELVVNPYFPTTVSQRAITLSGDSGEYWLQATGHGGTVRVRASMMGYTLGLYELGFVRRDRTVRFNFALQRDEEGRVKVPRNFLSSAR